MKDKQPWKKKEAYTKPEVFTHEPLRNITAAVSYPVPTVSPT